jgi:hypothetical protein
LDDEAEPVVTPDALLDLAASALVMLLFVVPPPRAWVGAMAVAAKKEATIRTEIASRLDRMEISSVDHGDAAKQRAVWVWVPSAPAKTPFPKCDSLRFRVVI